MDINDNSSIIQNIINIFKNNFEFIDLPIVKEVYDLLVEKDNKDEYNLKNIIDNIFENDDDKMKCEPSTKETSQNNSSSNPNFNNDDDLESFNQNVIPNSFKRSSQEYKKKYPDVAIEIFEIVSLLDEKKIEEVLTEVKNQLNNN